MLISRSRARRAVSPGAFVPALCGLALAACVLGSPRRAHAFTEPRTYYEHPAEGGGGNRFFTGSPAEGYGCGVCHSGPARAFALTIDGLPKDGYEPGATYELVLRYADFADFARKKRQRREPPAAVGLVAELVAESGVGAGTLEVSGAQDARDEELCTLPAGLRAAQLYAVRPLEPTREAGLRCEALALGQRCIAATISCGASELRMRWTAPAEVQGPIWLSGGFVTAEQAAGDPHNDAVIEIDEVILPKGSAGRAANMRLQSGCSVTRAHGRAVDGASAALVTLVALVTLLLGVRPRRRQQLRVALAAVLSMLAGVGCAERQRPQIPEGDYGRYPQAGLFTPGNRIGADFAALDAAVDDGGEGGTLDREAEDAINEASGQNRCVEREGSGTEGRLEIEFVTDTYGGFYAPANCGAVWIEDDAGQYVATPLIWAGLRTRNLFIWDARRCGADRPDAISSATLEQHGEQQRASWDTKDHRGRVVPDGRYVLNIEITEDEFDYGRRTQVPFDKGPAASSLQPDDDESVKALTLTFTPKAEP